MCSITDSTMSQAGAVARVGAWVQQLHAGSSGYSEDDAPDEMIVEYIAGGEWWLLGACTQLSRLCYKAVVTHELAAKHQQPSNQSSHRLSSDTQWK